MRYKHTNINLLFNEMMEDLNYIKKKTTFLNIKK